MEIILNNYSRIRNLMVKASTYYVNNEHKKAIYFYNQVLQIDPENTDALYNKGLSYKNL